MFQCYFYQNNGKMEQEMRWMSIAKWNEDEEIKRYVIATLIIFFFYSFYMGCAQCSLLWFCIEISIMAMWKCSDFTYIQCIRTICCCFVLCVASHFTVDFIHFLFLLFPPMEYNLFNRYSRYICIKGYYSYTMKGKKN